MKEERERAEIKMCLYVIERVTDCIMMRCALCV